MNATKPALSQWRALGGVAPTRLVDARLQLHHAVQIIVSAPISFLPPRADDSHTNLEWLSAESALGTNWLAGARRLRYAVRPETLSLLALDERSAVASELCLEGRTTDDAVDWLRESLAAAGFDSARFSTRKHYEIPGHPVGLAAPYELMPQEHAELGRYYANAHELTAHVARTRAGASEPRCWPHHFDLATLITLPSEHGKSARTVGVGMSPGDDSYAEPYFYVGPNPQLPVARLRPIGSLGVWHTQDWVGAVLRASEIVSLGDARAQAAGVWAFTNAAIDASVTASDVTLGSTPDP